MLLQVDPTNQSTWEVLDPHPASRVEDPSQETVDVVDESSIEARLFLICTHSGTEVFICLFNILLLRALTTLEKTSNVNNLFYVNLAICDLLVGLTTGPATITTAIFDKWMFGNTMCNLIAATDNLLIITGTLTLAASSIDRCLAVSKPLWHRSYITGTVVKQWIVVVWLVAVVVSILPFFNYGNYQYSKHSYNCGLGLDQNKYSRSYFLLVILMALLIPIAIVFACYSLILYVVMPSLISRHRMTHNGQTDKTMDSSSGPRSTAIEIEEQTAVKIQAVNSSVAITLPDKIVPDESCRADPRLCRMSSVSKMYRRRSSGRLATRKKRSVMSVTLRPALRTLAIVGVFFVCTGPTFITSLIYWHNPENVKVPLTVSWLMHWMVFLNSAVNPLVFGLMDRDIKRFYINTLCFPCISLWGVIRFKN